MENLNEDFERVMFIKSEARIGLASPAETLGEFRYRKNQDLSKSECDCRFRPFAPTHNGLGTCSEITSLVVQKSPSRLEIVHGVLLGTE